MLQSAVLLDCRPVGLTSRKTPARRTSSWSNRRSVPKDAKRTVMRFMPPELPKSLNWMILPSTNGMTKPTISKHSGGSWCMNHALHRVLDEKQAFVFKYTESWTKSSLSSSNTRTLKPQNFPPYLLIPERLTYSRNFSLAACRYCRTLQSVTAGIRSHACNVRHTNRVATPRTQRPAWASLSWNHINTWPYFPMSRNSLVPKHEDNPCDKRLQITDWLNSHHPQPSLSITELRIKSVPSNPTNEASHLAKHSVFANLLIQNDRKDTARRSSQSVFTTPKELCCLPQKPSLHVAEPWMW